MSFCQLSRCARLTVSAVDLFKQREWQQQRYVVIPPSECYCILKHRYFHISLREPCEVKFLVSWDGIMAISWSQTVNRTLNADDKTPIKFHTNGLLAASHAHDSIRHQSWRFTWMTSLLLRRMFPWRIHTLNLVWLLSKSSEGLRVDAY